MNFLFPVIRRHQWVPMLEITFAAALAAGLFGIVHDQITYTIGPEYFTRLKFHQFAWANLGLPPRLFAAEIGFIASACAGAVAGWTLARIAVPAWPRSVALRKAAAAFVVVFACTLAGAITGFGLAHLRGPNADFSNWDIYLLALQIRDPAAFVMVAYIHNGSYLGGAIGLIVAAIWLMRSRPARG